MTIKVLSSNDAIVIRNTVVSGRTVEDASGLKTVEKNNVQKVSGSQTVLRSDTNLAEGVHVDVVNPAVNRVSFREETLRRDEAMTVQSVVESRMLFRTTLFGPTGPKGDPGNVEDLVIPDLLQIFNDAQNSDWLAIDGGTGSVASHHSYGWVDYSDINIPTVPLLAGVPSRIERTLVASTPNNRLQGVFSTHSFWDNTDHKVKMRALDDVVQMSFYLKVRPALPDGHITISIVANNLEIWRKSFLIAGAAGTDNSMRIDFTLPTRNNFFTYGAEIFITSDVAAELLEFSPEFYPLSIPEQGGGYGWIDYTDLSSGSSTALVAGSPLQIDRDLIASPSNSKLRGAFANHDFWDNDTHTIRMRALDDVVQMSFYFKIRPTMPEGDLTISIVAAGTEIARKAFQVVGPAGEAQGIRIDFTLPTRSRLFNNGGQVIIESSVAADLLEFSPEFYPIGFRS